MPVAAEFILAHMSGLIGERTMLIATVNPADRFSICYDEPEPQSMVDFDILSQLCEGFHNIDYFDVIPDLRNDYDTTGLRFEDGHDNHMNGYGNYIAARAIARRPEASGTINRITRE